MNIELHQSIIDVKNILDIGIQASGRNEIVYGVILKLHSFSIFISISLLAAVIDAAIATCESKPISLESALWRFLLKSRACEYNSSTLLPLRYKTHLNPDTQNWALELNALTDAQLIQTKNEI